MSQIVLRPWQTLRECEYAIILAHLHLNGGRRKDTARRLGMPWSTFAKRLREMGDLGYDLPEPPEEHLRMVSKFEHMKGRYKSREYE